MRLGGRLKIAREHRGLKQEELATLASTHATISQAAISALESRDSETTTYLFAFARALRVNPEWLQTGDGESGLEQDEWRPAGVLSEATLKRVLELSNELHSLLREICETPEKPLLERKEEPPLSADAAKQKRRRHGT